MRAIPAVVVAALVSVLVALPTAGAVDPPPTPPTRPVEDLIRDLGSGVFSTRERAGGQLWQRGREAIPALEKAAAGANPEVARRARAVLDRLDWGDFPDTPPAVLKQIARFRAGTPDEQKAALTDLLKLGGPGRSAAGSILSRNLPADTRDPLVAHLTAHLRREVPLLLFAGKADEAGEWLALHAAGTTPEGAADAAAFRVLRDDLPAAIADAEAARKTARTPDAANLLLAHLYRAARDWPKARAAGAAVPRPEGAPDLVEMLLEEEGAWAALLDRPHAGPLNLPAAHRLSLLRLAGRQKEFDAGVKDLRASADELFERESVRDAAFGLLLNHRAADATALLVEKRRNLGLLAEIHIARLQFKEALALTGPVRVADDDDDSADAKEKHESDLRRARVLVLVGRRDEAVQLFTRVADGLKNLTAEADDWDDLDRARRSLVRSELRVGLRDLACEHAGGFLPEKAAEVVAGEGTETVFDILFGSDAAAARYLHRTLRRADADRPGGTTMRAVRNLLDGTATKEQVEAAVKALTALAHVIVEEGGPAEQARRQTAFALVYRGAGRHAEAETAIATAAGAAVESDGPNSAGPRSWVFGKSDASRPWLNYGDFLHDRGRFADAAAAYGDGWKRFPDDPLLLFLSGKALAKAGDAKEGDRRVELAHWVALGNERARGKFLEELIRRGERRAAKRETDLLLRACWSRDYYFGNVMNQAARAAAMNHDWATARACVQRSLFVLMKSPGVHYQDSAAYLNVPHDMLAYRARELLAAGKVDEAVARARAVLEITPGHAELASGMVPDLDKLGRKTEADELFGRVWSAYRRVLADYPDSPAARNALAALGANCRRELDAALKYAGEAVAADPKSVAYRETLAEVHFRRGARDRALAVMQKLAAEHPRSHFYRRQLERYKTGDAASPTPDAED